MSTRPRSTCTALLRPAAAGGEGGGKGGGGEKAWALKVATSV